jgi:hypothetical protein
MTAFFIIISVIGVIGLVVGIVVLALAKDGGIHRTTIDEIGEHGENLVAQFLSNDQNSIVFNDIILVDSNTKKSSQIDHVVIRPNGVFVIETKNLAGKVYGNDSQLEWTQVLAFGGTKNRFYNPVKQNTTHIYFLAKALKQHNIYIPIVIFLRAELYIQTAALVCNGQNSLYQALNSYTGINLTAEQMQNIATQLAEFKANPQVTKEEHVRNIFKTQYEIANNICPRCGKPLVMRNGKGGQFYGCSGYPNCRFTKNI